MALIECPECGRTVSDHAKACPDCGFPVAEWVGQNQNEKRQDTESNEDIEQKKQKASIQEVKQVAVKIESLIENYVKVYPEKDKDTLLLKFLEGHLSGVPILEEKLQELKEEEKVGNTKFNISGDKIIIPTEVKNERYIKEQTKDLIARVGSIFDKWYGSQGDCNSVYRNSSEVLNSAVGPIIKKGVQILNSQGVYRVDENIFKSQYLNGYADDFHDVLSIMMEQIGEIEGQQNLEKQYRQIRKDNRSRVVGGGFGFSGAIKGMTQAGMMNATTGMLHSARNMIGNMGSSIAAGSNKAGVYKNFKEPLEEALVQSAYNVRQGIRNALKKEAGIICRYVTKNESDQATAIFQSYMQNRIPKNQQKSEMLKALQLNPYDMEIYQEIWKEYGDKNGDLCKMANFFDIPLEKYFKEVAETHGNEVFTKKCGAYLTAFDKNAAAILLEDKVKETLSELKIYCDGRGLPYATISIIDKCKGMLQRVDTELKSVDGVVYETREVAAQIAEDYKKFYTLLDGKNLQEEEAFNSVCKINFGSEKFKQDIREIFNKEREQRLPQHIYKNSDLIIQNYLKASTIELGFIDIPAYRGAYDMKSELVQTITEMPSEEMPIVFFSRSANGKSGVLITNVYFRIFSKGLLGSENRTIPIETIDSVECTGENDYVVKTNDQRIEKFTLKLKNLSAEEQINVGKVINKEVQLVNRLYSEDRRLLFRIIHGVIVCECGMPLVKGENVCPSCHKMWKEDGSFVETMVCPNCKNYIPKGKKFCFICGSKVEKNEGRGQRIYKKDIYLVRNVVRKY